LFTTRNIYIRIESEEGADIEVSVLALFQDEVELRKRKTEDGKTEAQKMQLLMKKKVRAAIV
jgi:hypothetical protein